jgi:hypothetical protein
LKSAMVLCSSLRLAGSGLLALGPFEC